MSDTNENARRGFLKLLSAGIGGLVSLALAPPLLDSVIAPSLRVKRGDYSRLVSLNELPTGTPVDRTFADRTSDAFIEETVLRDVWVVKQGPSTVDVFSPICPHLGCRYGWHPERRQFVCPCHGSVFAPSGEVVGGPAPRSLDTLPIRMEGDEIFVEWERFKVGIAQKVVV
jgi:menaquinol-cytochrome c reductase iron-sulfur subunit